MKIISMANTSPNWYYTMKEHDTTVEGSKLTGKCTITGICRENAQVGDVLDMGKISYTIESIEKRNAAGVWNNPEDAKDAFFTAETSFTRFIN